MNDVKGTFVLENAMKPEVRKRIIGWDQMVELDRLVDERELKKVEQLEDNLMGLLDDE